MAIASASVASSGTPASDTLEEPLDHRRHLGLVGRAVAADRLLHLVRGRLVDRDVRLRGREQRDASRLADRHRRLHVALEEEALDPDALGPMLADERAAAPRGAA